MALAKLLELSENKNMQKVGISEERLKAIIPVLRISPIGVSIQICL